VSYEGQWRHGKRHGHGALTATHYTYTGGFAGGLFHGRGTYKSKLNALEYEGTWAGGTLSHGALTMPDGERDVRDWATFGSPTVKEAALLILGERKGRMQAALAHERETRGKLVGMKLMEYVSNVKKAIHAARDKEAAYVRDDERATKLNNAAKEKQAKRDAALAAGEAALNESEDDDMHEVVDPGEDARDDDDLRSEASSVDYGAQ